MLSMSRHDDSVNPQATGIGAPLARVEDDRFLRGAGRFVDDVAIAGALYCHLIRSPHAHARISEVDASAAISGPGVIAVLTGADMEADRVGPMRCMWRVASVDGKPATEPARWALARGTVRYVGEPVAVVIAETAVAAVDGAERVRIRYQELKAVTVPNIALAEGAVQLHDDAPGNVCFRFARGVADPVFAALAASPYRIILDLTNNRLTGAALEPRSLLAVPDPVADSITLYAGTQVPHHVRKFVAEQLRMPEIRLRVVAPDVGGGFGYKGKHYPEETIVTWAARRLRRPLRWTSSRCEGFVSDTQARDHLTRAELGLDANGRFLALAVDTKANIGAYVSTFGAAIPSAIYSGLLAGMYRTPLIHVVVTGAFTNTVPTDAYRGAGRPEAAYVLERLADAAARELGLTREQVRRCNLIPADAMPYTTPIGSTYDCGDFPNIFERALKLAPTSGAPSAPGQLQGRGLALYIESSGVAPSRLAGAGGGRTGFFEAAEVRVDGQGGITALLGTHNHGQGHATTFAQILSEKLGIPTNQVVVIEGDTGVVPLGTGTFGSRSIAVGGSALAQAADKVVAKGAKLAAHLLEANEQDIEFEDGSYRVCGTDRALSFVEIAAAANTAHDYPAGFEPGLNETAVYDPPSFTYSNGCHVCDVEIDPETGEVTVVGYWAVDDVGTVINPVIVAGQVHGGLAQGIGQALVEECIYDSDTGQPLSASFMDYAIPRADDLPFFVSEIDESQPCTFNPLGAKGCGETGAIAAPAAVTAAVLDALAALGVTDISMRIAPERVWAAIRDA